MNFMKNIIGIFCAFIIVSTVNNLCDGKSVFVFPNIDNKEIRAYKIDGDSLTQQINKNNVTTYSSPIDMAIHESDFGKELFCSFEGVNKIEFINAQDLISDGEVIIPNATNIAGVVFDNTKTKLYAVNRYRNRLWSYSWNPAAQTLLPDFNSPYYVTLEGLEWDGNSIGAFGITLDEKNNLLYVADNTDTVECYDTNNWSKISEVNVPCNAISVAVDANRQFLYFGSMGQYGEGDPCLYQYNLLTDEKRWVFVGSSVAGIAVDQQTGLIYITTYETKKLIVYDANLVQHSTPISLTRPTGIVVAEIGYKNVSFDIVQDDNDAGCVEPLISEELHEFGIPYNWLYYNINWDANGFADSNVVVTVFLPKEVNEPNFISDGGEYFSELHAVKWFVGDVNINSSGLFKIRVGVNNWAKPGGVITSKAVIEGDRYTYWRTLDTDVCVYGGEIIYVDKKAETGHNNGTSWDDAYLSLQDGLTAARNCGAAVTAIWVGASSYQPVEEMITGYADKRFELLSDLAVIGHFGGVGTYEDSPDQRVLADTNNAAILEGRIGTTRQEAVKQIVYAKNISNVLLDGFTVRNSYGQGANGAYIENSDISIVNCRFENNSENAIYANGYSYPSIYNCVFFNNKYGLYIQGYSQSDVSYSIFDGNNVGGTFGLYISSCSVTLEDCIVKNNKYRGINGSESGLSISRSQFENNYHGLYLNDVTTDFIDSTIENSTVNCLYSIYSDVLISNSSFRNSTQDALKLENYSNADIENSTIENSSSNGINVSNSTITLNNTSIAYSNSYGVNCSSSDITLENSSIENSSSNGINGSGSTITLNNSSLENSNNNGINASNATITLNNSSIENSTSHGVICSASIIGIENSSIKNNGQRGISAGDSDVSVSHSILANNYDNAIYMSTGSNNLILENSVIRYSGGYGLELIHPITTTIKNSWIHKNGTRKSANDGRAGIYIEGPAQTPIIRNSTIYDNNTYGIQMDQYGPDPNVRNCIIYGNDVNDFYRIAGGSAFGKIRYSCLQHSHSGTGNFVADPMLMNGSDPNNLHLADGSPCIDAGDPFGSYPDETDIDGEVRNNGIVDCGGDESYWSRADYDESGNVDFRDLAIFAEVWQRESETISLDDDNDVDIYDLALFCKDWLWQNQIGSGGMMSMMMGGGEGESLMMQAECEVSPMTETSLMITDLQTSKAMMPKKLAEKVNSFYAITPQSVAQWKARTANLFAEQAVDSEMQAEQVVDVNEILNWLDDLWQSDDEIRTSMTEEEYLNFRNSIEESGE